MSISACSNTVTQIHPEEVEDFDGSRELMQRGGTGRGCITAHLRSSEILYLLSTVVVYYFVFCFFKVAGRSYDLEFDFNLEQEFVKNSGLYVFHETESQADKEMYSAERREAVREKKALSPSGFSTCICDRFY